MIIDQLLKVLVLLTSNSIVILVFPSDSLFIRFIPILFIFHHSYFTTLLLFGILLPYTGSFASFDASEIVRIWIAASVGECTTGVGFGVVVESRISPILAGTDKFDQLTLLYREVILQYN